MTKPKFQSTVPSVIVTVAVALASMSCSFTSNEDKKTKHHERGLAYFQQEKYQEALIEFKNVVQLDPKDADSHYRLALIYLKLGGLPNLQAAFAELTRATELDPSNRDAQLKLGAMYLIGSKPDKALEHANLVLTSTPQDVEGLVLKGQSLIGEKDYERGVEELQKAIQLDPKNVRIRLDLARTYVLMKDQKSAEATLLQALEVDPQSTDVRLALGDFRALNEQVAEAEFEYKRVIEMAPDKDYGYLKLASFYQLKRRWADAEAVYQQLAAKKPKDDNPQLILGEFYWYVGQRDKSVAAYQKATELNPTSVPARNRLIDTYLKAGIVDKADALINPALEKNPKDLELQFLDARVKFARGKVDEAADIFLRILKDEPQSAGAHYFLGLAFMAKNDAPQARRELTDAVKYAPAMYDARTALAILHYSEGTLDLATEQAKAAIQLNPLRPQPIILLADIYLRQGELEKGKKIYDALTKVAPNEPIGYYKLGLIARAEKKDAEALAYFEQALTAKPNAVDALSQIVQIKAMQGKIGEGRERVARQLEKVPNDPALLTLQGRILTRTNEYSAAEVSFRKAIEVAPNSAPPYLYLAELYRAQGKLDDAVKEYEGLLVKNPKMVSAHFILGMIHENRRNTDKAKERYQEALKIEPKFAPAANNLAYILLEQGGDIDEALGYAQTARESAPEDPSIADTLGWIYYNKKAYLKAIDLLKEASDKLGDNPIVQYHYGMALYANGDRQGARKNLQTALRLSDKFPGSDEAKTTLNKL